jgi:hypothetical protein
LVLGARTATTLRTGDDVTAVPIGLVVPIVSTGGLLVSLIATLFEDRPPYSNRPESRTTETASPDSTVDSS